MASLVLAGGKSISDMAPGMLFSVAGFNTHSCPVVSRRPLLRWILAIIMIVRKRFPAKFDPRVSPNGTVRYVEIVSFVTSSHFHVECT